MKLTKHSLAIWKTIMKAGSLEACLDIPEALDFLDFLDLSPEYGRAGSNLGERYEFNQEVLGGESLDLEHLEGTKIAQWPRFVICSDGSMGLASPMARVGDLLCDFIPGRKLVVRQELEKPTRFVGTALLLNPSPTTSGSFCGSGTLDINDLLRKREVIRCYKRNLCCLLSYLRLGLRLLRVFRMSFSCYKPAVESSFDEKDLSILTHGHFALLFPNYEPTRSRFTKTALSECPDSPRRSRMRSRPSLYNAVVWQNLGSCIKRRKVVAKVRAGTKKLLGIMKTD